ncbi:hypothetical protein GCM10010116_59660 [Microbispora rosea subsp. aerata]|nr:hypothetical protein [Microbispora rosea]GGO29715.1 hypothetical protein GCM10010116_59660 [Microbispora rosea subsp. aerata]GIH58949.1 hypothetical protein Mro02_58630 [Microbispora rosea subsp. aerata]GLJ86183.1 hypothetical protein GCM10017588_49170 [Microbispora rosea subsp. aerata]
MTNQTDNFPDLMSDDSFEVVMRGYSRRQVHDYMTRTRNQIRDLEERLARTIDQAEQARLELAEARRRMAEAPQNPDELGERLSQILKLAQEEAAANKEASEAEARRVRESAAAEAERLVTSAREQADAIRAAAQEEAERRVADATATAERLLAQAGAEAEETLGSARAEGERQLTAARMEAERVLAEARGQAESMLAAAQQRVNALDEHTGRRVAYLTDTHAEVVRRLNEIGSVLGDLMQREAAAGPLIDEAAVLPPPPQVHAAPTGTPDQPHAPGEESRQDIEAPQGGHSAHAAGSGDYEAAAGQERGDFDDSRGDFNDSSDEEQAVLIVDDGRHENGHAGSPSPDDTDVNLGRVRRALPDGESVAGM